MAQDQWIILMVNVFLVTNLVRFFRDEMNLMLLHRNGR